MSRNIVDEISLDNVKSVVETLLEEMKKRRINIFKNKPTIEVFYKGGSFIGLSLIDDNNSELKCYWQNTPRFGIKHLFLLIHDLKNDTYLPWVGIISSNRLIAQIEADSAYNTNIERVNRLLSDGHNAVAIVFLVSALENIAHLYILLIIFESYNPTLSI